MREDIYTSDGTIKTPDGREYASVAFAAKAYGYTEEEFMARLDTGCTLREAFLGYDLPCGLQYGLDKKLHDYNNKGYDTLEEMCQAHGADVEWFNKLYAVTKDVEIALKQEHKTQEYLDDYVKMMKEEQEKKDKELKAFEEARRKKLQARNRAIKAKKMYKKYMSVYMESYRLIPLEIAWQILRLGEFLYSLNLLDYDEKRMYVSAQNSVIYGETNVLDTENVPNEELVCSILKDFKCTGDVQVRVVKDRTYAEEKMLLGFIRKEKERNALINKRKAAKEKVRQSIAKGKAQKCDTSAENSAVVDEKQEEIKNKQKEEAKKKQREEETLKRKKRSDDAALLAQYGTVMVDDYGQFVIINKKRVRADDIRNSTSTFMKAISTSAINLNIHNKLDEMTEMEKVAALIVTNGIEQALNRQ